jgi:uncharacterized protein (TIGR02246 family)
MSDANDPATDPAPVAVRFNDAITARDAGALAALMTADHTFTDTEGNVIAGRQACRAAWEGFFAAFPDYRNVFTEVSAAGDTVTIIGHSICAEPALAGPARWTATIRDGRVAHWRVDED